MGGLTNLGALPPGARPCSSMLGAGLGCQSLLLRVFTQMKPVEGESDSEPGFLSVPCGVPFFQGFQAGREWWVVVQRPGLALLFGDGA